MTEETNGALEPSIYPILTAWGFTTEENRVPSDAEIVELLENVGYERVRLEGNIVRPANIAIFVVHPPGHFLADGSFESSHQREEYS